MRVLVFREHDLSGHHAWIAQCLEVDIAGHGDTIAAALLHLEEALVSHLVVNFELGMQPFENVPPAPSDLLVRYGEQKAVPLAPDWPKLDPEPKWKNRVSQYLPTPPRAKVYA
jgi:hypothetical protein